MIDQTLLTFFNQTLANPWLDLMMLGFTYLGLAFLPALAIALLMGQHRRVGLAILAALAASLVLTFIFQYLALRPRPEAVRLLVPTPNFPSFPSGHAAAAFATAAVLSLTYRRWWGLALAGASLIAVSRVYLGVHYPSDSLAGAMLGAGVGAASYGLIVTRRPGQSAWGWLVWPQAAVMGVMTLMAYLGILPWSLLQWPMSDKVLHFLMFGAVVFWLNLWLEGRSLPLSRWAIPLGLLIPLAVASVEELAQGWSPLRTVSLGDWLSNLAGMLFFCWLSYRIMQSNRQISPQ